MSRLNNWFITDQIYYYKNYEWSIATEKEYFIKCGVYDRCSVYDIYNLLDNTQPEMLDFQYRYIDGGIVGYSFNLYEEQENGFNFDVTYKSYISNTKFIMCGGGYDLLTDGNAQSQLEYLKHR